MEKIFGLTKEQIRKQSGNPSKEGDYLQSPIRAGETFEPCLRGSQKILDDPEQTERMRRIYRSAGKSK